MQNIETLFTFPLAGAPESAVEVTRPTTLVETGPFSLPRWMEYAKARSAIPEIQRVAALLSSRETYARNLDMLNQHLLAFERTIRTVHEQPLSFEQEAKESFLDLGISLELGEYDSMLPNTDAVSKELLKQAKQVRATLIKVGFTGDLIATDPQWKDLLQYQLPLMLEEMADVSSSSRQ